MPRIFDNLSQDTRLAPALQATLAVSQRADFCIGYFNLRGWGSLAPHVDKWNPEDGHGPCRLLIGMQRLPNEELREVLALRDSPPSMDNATAHRLRVQLAEQLTFGLPHEVVSIRPYLRASALLSTITEFGAKPQLLMIGRNARSRASLSGGKADSG